MTWLRSNADLLLMAVALGAGSLAYATGAFVMGLALHPPRQHGWSGVEMVAVTLYPLGWIGLAWGTGVLWTRWRHGRSASRQSARGTTWERLCSGRAKADER